MTNDSGIQDINDKIKNTTYLTWRIVLALAKYSRSLSEANVPKKRPVSSRALKRNIQKLCSWWDVTLHYGKYSMPSILTMSQLRSVRNEMIEAIEHYANNPGSEGQLHSKMKFLVEGFAYSCCARLGYMDALFSIRNANPSQS